MMFELFRRIGICPACRRFKTTIEKRQRNTQYVNEESNWLTACADCQHEDDEYFRDLWSQYYSGLM